MPIQIVMLKPFSGVRKSWLGLAAFLLIPLAVSAQETYDRYAPVYREISEPSTAKNIARHFLVYPFELLKWPADKGLIYDERYRIHQKVQWAYDTITDQGIQPRLGLVSIGRFNAGADVDLIRLARLKENFPDLTAKTWLQWTKDTIFETGAKGGMERIANTGFYTHGVVNYSSRPEEHFYGMGPDTSAGDGTSFKMEETKVQAIAGYSPNPIYGADIDFAYKNVNITNGEDGGRGIIDEIFPGGVPGLDGDVLISTGVELKHDTRNRQENSTQGGQERFALHFNEGVGNSEARYFKYVLEASRFFSVGSPRRVLAFHFYGEHNDELGDKVVPFHQMARLGGFGSYPYLSQTLRGYDFNRFFGESSLVGNLEYRYTIWEYRDAKLDAVFFFDQGQTFNEFSEFQWQDFRPGYGGGFRGSIVNHVVLSVEIAHSDEGTSFYAKSSAPF